MAHRISYIIAYDSIPQDMLVCHSCDNPLCVRPTHLFLGTNADNVRDKELKGRGNHTNSNHHAPPGLTVEERFWRLVDKKSDNECWEWIGHIKGGYGSITINHKSMKGHRVSYELHNGKIPDGLIVRHRCDNQLCVNPNHLELGTYKDNGNDKAIRGRAKQLKGEQSHASKLTQKQADYIRTSTITHKELSMMFDVSRKTIRNIQQGKSWKPTVDN